MSGAEGDKPDAAARTEVAKAESERVADTRQRELGFPDELRELIGVERERIESANRRIEVARYMIQMNDASDKRQYDFQMEKLNSEEANSKRKHKFAVGIAIGGFCLIVAGSILLLGMAFFGTENQTTMSFSIMKALGLGVAGYGIIGAVARAVRALVNQVGKIGQA